MTKADAVLKTVLVTGSTDGLGLEAAKLIVSRGHRLLLHGRNATKLSEAEATLRSLGAGEVETYKADLSKLSDVAALAKEVAAKHPKLDVLVNNAGVFKIPQVAVATADGYDARFAVNTIAPYLLMKRLLPNLGSTGRVVNLSSAAQAPVDFAALSKLQPMSDNAAYAQSKLAIAMWSRTVGRAVEGSGPVIIALNPGSFLGTKMVKDAYGVAGNDIAIGASIVARTSLDEEFAGATARYWDNDAGSFNEIHPDGLNEAKSEELVKILDGITANVQ